MSHHVPAGARFVFDIGVHAVQEQLRRIDGLDTKAGVLLAVDGVLAGLVFGRGSLLLDAPRGFTVAAAVTLVVSFGLALIVFGSRRYDVAPWPPAVTRVIDQDEEWLRWRFGGNVLTAFDVNHRTLIRKARLLSAALSNLLVTIGLLGGYFIYAVARGSVS